MFKKVVIITVIILSIFSMNIQGQILVKSKLTQKYQLNPGSISEGKIIVKSNLNHKTIVKLYMKDYSFDYDGNNYYSKAGSNPRSNSEWIYLSKKKIELKPLEEREIKYMIKVPDKNNYSGTYWSMIMVEEDSIVSYNDKNNFKSSVGFKQNIRYGIQIITNFSSNKKINLKYKDVEIIKKDTNTYIFELAVLNNNNYLIDSNTKIILINRDTGNIKDQYLSKNRNLYPETSIKIKKEFNLKENIPYKIVAITGNEKHGYHGKEYSVEVENN